LQPLPKQCLDQVDAVLDRVRTPDAKDAESIANYAPLVGMGWDPKTCTMDWIEAAHVGLVLRGGSKEAAQCNLTFAIKQWLEYKKAVAADSTNSKPLSGGGGRMGPPYQQKIIDDPVYKNKWPMPNAPAVFQKIGVGQKLGVLQNASAASGEDGGAAKIVAWTVGIGALALLGAWIGGVWPFASKKNETVRS
jgi:hypothetical protein